MTYDFGLKDWEKAEFLEAARLAGAWFVNTQHSPQRPWGPVRASDSADNGRYIEKCRPSRDLIAPAAIWIHGIATFAMLDLSKTPVIQPSSYRDSALLAAKYLAACNCVNADWPKGRYGFHEFFPGDAYSAPRDGASAAMACVALFRHTGESSWLTRAIRFADWYATHGSDADGFPWDDYDLEKGQGVSKLRGDWQAGGGLLYYQLFRLTGEERFKTALRKVLDMLETVCAHDPGTDTAYTFHGQCVISIGNDDFANTVLLAGYRLFGEKRYLDLFCKRLRAEWSRQAPDGAFPGYGGTFVTALEMAEALEFHAEGVATLPEAELRDRLLRAARFTLTLQEKQSIGRFVLGGVYGESNYATARDIVHARDTAYGLLLWLKLAGHAAPAYAVLDWEKP
ncbi:MAG: hypothetical protein LUQ69_10400 [Methanoregulaceae archaeon]|nr:hypothetical protein [Methanoregulaceae archaeon]